MAAFQRFLRVCSAPEVLMRRGDKVVVLPVESKGVPALNLVEGSVAFFALSEMAIRAYWLPGRSMQASSVASILSRCPSLEEALSEMNILLRRTSGKHNGVSVNEITDVDEGRLACALSQGICQRALEVHRVTRGTMDGLSPDEALERRFRRMANGDGLDDWSLDGYGSLVLTDCVSLATQDLLAS